jgi:hypothetical protein
MPEEKYFLITQKELEDLIIEKDVMKRTAILIRITARTYKEKTLLDNIASGLGSVVKALDDMTEPDTKKKRGK